MRRRCLIAGGKRSETPSADDFIFVKQGGPATMVNLTEKDGSYHASLIIGVERNR